MSENPTKLPGNIEIVPAGYKIPLYDMSGDLVPDSDPTAPTQIRKEPKGYAVRRVRTVERRYSSDEHLQQDADAIPF